MDRPVEMLGRAIDGVQPQGFIAGIHHVVRCALRHDDRQLLARFGHVEQAVDNGQVALHRLRPQPDHHGIGRRGVLG